MAVMCGGGGTHRKKSPSIRGLAVAGAPSSLIRRQLIQYAPRVCFGLVWHHLVYSWVFQSKGQRDFDVNRSRRHRAEVLKRIKGGRTWGDGGQHGFKFARQVGRGQAAGSVEQGHPRHPAEQHCHANCSQAARYNNTRLIAVAAKSEAAMETRLGVGGRQTGRTCPP